MYMALISRQGSPRSRLILHHSISSWHAMVAETKFLVLLRQRKVHIYIYIYVTNACLKTTQLGQFPAVYEQGM